MSTSLDNFIKTELKNYDNVLPCFSDASAFCGLVFTSKNMTARPYFSFKHKKFVATGDMFTKDNKTKAYNAFKIKKVPDEEFDFMGFMTSASEQTGRLSLSCMFHHKDKIYSLFYNSENRTVYECALFSDMENHSFFQKKIEMIEPQHFCTYRKNMPQVYVSLL